MSSPTRRAAARDPRRESSGDESETDQMLEEARRIALAAQQRFLDLQQRSQGKATPPAPAPTPAAAEQPQEDPHQEHRAPPLPADPRGPAPPPPPSPAPAAPAPNPRGLPTLRRREVRIRSSPPQHHRRPRSCLLYTSPSPRDQRGSRMPSSA